MQRKRAGPVRGSALARQLAPTFQVRIGLLPFAQMIYNSWWGCERGVNVSGGRRNVKVHCLLAFFGWFCRERKEEDDLIFIKCSSVAVLESE